ncbi:hypothetical protein M5D96_006885 [Drosophila gunungcola]|uniref:trypsin n=1 Tax=Drosophila gunungcola TaxID=103775 RepID=A0A9Q0BQJ9_9MUSC|nr:hypothetical protein M5D96_006885 [Drosophila gunungcola]
MNSQNLVGLLLLFLQLPHSGSADPSHNAPSISLNRTKRLTDANFDDESIRLSHFVVSIRTRTARMFFGDNHFCSGVILSPLFVLTSSHCVIETFVTPVKRIMLPDNFTMVNQQDIGLLKLKHALPRNSKHISVARMPLQSPQPGLRCNVMGWGRMFLAGPMASYLLYIDVVTIESRKCAELLKVPTVDLLCAIDDNPFTDQQPCVGDWGSPLMHGSTVYGIVSVIVGCGDDTPSVYTDVYKNIDWIQEKINTDAGSTISVPHLLVYFLIVIFQKWSFSLFIFVGQN